MVKKIIWTNLAESNLHNCFLELLEQSKSVDITSRIITEVYESVSILSTDSEIYKLDTLKTNNKGNIRAFQKHSYRISYLIKDNEVYILRVKHSRKEPLKY